MGLNTSVIIRNDALNEIKDDKEFGQKLYEAVNKCSGEKNVDIRAGSFVNAASVVETHHADFLTVVSFGGNTAEKLGYGGNYRNTKEEILKALAEQLGYRLVKKKAKK